MSTIRRVITELADTVERLTDVVSRSFQRYDDLFCEQSGFNAEANRRVTGLQLATADSGWIKVEDFANGWTGDVTVSMADYEVTVDGAIERGSGSEAIPEDTNLRDTEAALAAYGRHPAQPGDADYVEILGGHVDGMSSDGGPATPGFEATLRPRHFDYPVIGNIALVLAPVFHGRAAMFHFDSEGGIAETVDVPAEDMSWDANAEQWLARIPDPNDPNGGTYIIPDVLELDESLDIEEC